MSWKVERLCWGKYDRDRLARQVQFAPDGSCVLCGGEGGLVAVYELSEKGGGLRPVVRTWEGDSVRDVAWYPWMTSADPQTCVYLGCCRDNPVHLWDAYTGVLRASYRCFNAMDEIVAPHSVSFHSSGEKIYCGFDGMLRIFDLGRPGRDCIEVVTSRKRQAGGQRGILSAMDWSRDGQGVLVVGSFRGTVGIYEARTPPRGCPAAMVQCNKSGITDVKIASDGVTIAAGGRRDNSVHVFDVRNMDRELFRVKRDSSTNQRIGLEISQDLLLTGSRDGQVPVFNLTTGEVLPPLISTDTCNSDVSVNPTVNMFATVHGERVFTRATQELSVGDAVDREDSNQDPICSVGVDPGKTTLPIDASLLLWAMESPSEGQFFPYPQQPAANLTPMSPSSSPRTEDALGRSPLAAPNPPLDRF